MLSRSIGTNIKKFRTEKRMSQEELAGKLFVTRQTVSNYETGKSHPDMDSLQQIAKALEVDMTWLLYGKPDTGEKKEKRNKLFLYVVVFAPLLAVTLVLLEYTGKLRLEHYITSPYMLTELVFVPASIGLLGMVLMQLIDYACGIGKPKEKLRKIGAITTYGVMGLNFAVMLPFLIWLISVHLQEVVPHDYLEATFPRIPVYYEIFWFFFRLAYNAPYFYVLIGVAFWLFQKPKK